MKRTLTVIFSLLLLTGVAFGQDYPGVITIDSVQAGPTETVAVKVWLRGNNIDVSAVTIPLQFSSSALTLDSISLDNTVWTSEFYGYAAIDNNAHEAQITILPDDAIYPLPGVSFVDGVVAELYFTVGSQATAQRVKIDSIYEDVTYGNIHVYTRIEVADNSGSGIYLPGFVPGDVEILGPTDVDDGLNSTLPTRFALAQNYPNPFNPTTVIDFDLPRAGAVRLEVFNILGQEISSPVNGYLEAGRHSVEFDGVSLPSGIYFYRLQYGEQSATRKMILVK